MMLHLINLIILFYGISKAQTTLELEWVREYTGDFELQDTRAIAVDDSGNVYVGITSFDTISDYGFTTVKYNPDGERLWVVKYEDDNPESNDYLKDIAVDQEGNVYVTGTSQFIQLDPFLLYRFFVTIKYNSDGEQQWLATYRNDITNTGEPYHIAVDSTGHVYVYGIYGTGFLIKYDSSGNKQWAKSIESGTLEAEYHLSDNSIYIGSNIFTVIKYDTSGNAIWTAVNDSLNIYNKAPVDIAVDNIGNVYISTVIKYDYNTDFLIAKFNNYGNFKWAKTYGGELYYHYRNPRICTDNNGFVYLGGYVFADYEHEDQFIAIKYDSSGKELWVEKYDDPLDTWAKLWNIEIDNLGNIYIIGHVTDYSTNNSDLALIKYDSDGNLIFSDFYGAVDRNEEASKIDIDKNNNVYITGDSYSSKGQKVLTLKYRQKPVSIERNTDLIPDNPVLNQNYPNPFNSSTNIFYSLPKTMHINIKIYDLLGQEVKSLFNGQKQAGEYKIVFNAENLASGIYIYRLTSQAFTLSRKLLLIK